MGVAVGSIHTVHVDERHARVVIVDDDPLLTEMVAALMDPIGCDVVGTGSTGAEAVDLVAATHPDVVVMDVDMPELDGIEATRRIRQEPEAPPVVLMSGAVDRRRIADARAAGAAMLVPKRSLHADLGTTLVALLHPGVGLRPALAGR